MIFKNIDISFDVCKECDRARMELLKNLHISNVIDTFEMVTFKNYESLSNFKMLLRDTDGIIEKHTYF